MNQLILIRTDASLRIGSGHVMRCLTLAENLRKKGIKIEFITRNHKGNLNRLIKNRKFDVKILPTETNQQKNLKGYEKWLSATQDEDAKDTIKALTKKQPDWIIIDHYTLDQTWAKKLRPYTKKIMVIDDLANRIHDCDLLLDQTYGRDKSDYKNLVPDKSYFLLGSENALLRPGFKKLRALAIKRREEEPFIKKIMVSMGSMDEANITLKVLDSLSIIDWLQPPIINVVLASGAPHMKEVKKIAAKFNFPVNVLTDVLNMADLMLESDLAIGSGGTTSWERCCMGLPTVLIVLAENQKKIGENLAQVGATITLQQNDNMKQNIKQAFMMLMKDKKKYLEMSHNASKVCDGNGAQRTVEKLLSIYSGEQNVV